MFQFISLKYFIFSFAIGLFFAYITGPESKIILIYPSLNNSDTILYKDHTNECFKFTPELVKCPKDESEIKLIPIQ